MKTSRAQCRLHTPHRKRPLKDIVIFLRHRAQLSICEHDMCNEVTQYLECLLDVYFYQSKYILFLLCSHFLLPLGRLQIGYTFPLLTVQSSSINLYECCVQLKVTQTHTRAHTHTISNDTAQTHIVIVMYAHFSRMLSESRDTKPAQPAHNKISAINFIAFCYQNTIKCVPESERAAVREYAETNELLVRLHLLRYRVFMSGYNKISVCDARQWIRANETVQYG